MINISPGVSAVAAPYRGILLDAYGVFWGGNEFGLLPGAKEIMEQLVSQGKIVGVLSNATQLATNEIQKLHRHGLVEGVHFHFLTTSGEISRHIFLNKKLPFNTPKNTFWLLGGVHPKFSSHEAIFQDTSYKETSTVDEADFIYISIPHVNGEDQENPEVFLPAIEKLKEKNLPMICPNPDQFAHEGNPPRAVVRQGSIALMYEKMGGQVVYMGKPHSQAYSHAMSHFARFNVVNPNEILMVGDTPETDIRGARRFGMPAALVTETGIMADRIGHVGLEKALQVLGSDDYPDFFITRL